MTIKSTILSMGAVATLLLNTIPAHAEEAIVTDPEMVTKLISGNVQRVWIAEAVEAPLGGESCEKGLRYRYRSDGTANVETCVDNTWKTDSIAWSVSGGNLDILTVVLEETTYEATLVERPDELELILEDPATSKDEKPQKVIMTYALD